MFPYADNEILNSLFNCIIVYNSDLSLKGFISHENIIEFADSLCLNGINEKKLHDKLKFISLLNKEEILSAQVRPKFNITS